MTVLFVDQRASGNALYGPMTGALGSVALPTFSRPVADISAGGWTPSIGSSLFACIDEVTEDDADYIKCTASGSIETAVLQISPPLPPGRHTRRFASNVTVGAARVRISLTDDSDTVLGDSGWIDVSNSVAVYAAAITITGTATRARIEGQGA